jgi:hypothetical protein
METNGIPFIFVHGIRVIITFNSGVEKMGMIIIMTEEVTN